MAVLEMNEFDWVEASKQYAQFIGVLAGFLFAIFAYLLTRPSPSSSVNGSDKRELSSLFVAFLGCLLSVFVLSYISGCFYDRPIPNDTNSEPVYMGVMEAIASLFMALSVVETLYALIILASSYGKFEPMKRLLRWVFMGMAIFTFLFAVPPILEVGTNEPAWKWIYPALVATILALVVGRRKAVLCEKLATSIVPLSFGAGFLIFFLMTLPAPEGLKDWYYSIVSFKVVFTLTLGVALGLKTSIVWRLVQRQL